MCYVPLLGHLSVSGAGVALQVTKITGGVLQTEAGLVSLRHLTPSGDLQQIIMAELVHAVVVPVQKKSFKEERKDAKHFVVLSVAVKSRISPFNLLR